MLATATADPPPANPARRIESLDQFRGFTVAGMLAVNFLGDYKAVVPAVFRHHNTYCSYADAIMPQFLLAVGFAARLTLTRRLDRDGPRPAYGHAVARCLGLLLLGFVIYHLDGEAKTWADLKALGLGGFFAKAFGRSYFQTLVHIALATLWCLPVIAAGTGARLAWMVASASLHVWLSLGGYYDWVMRRPGIDGGPLGFLTWTIPLIVGTIAYDIVAEARRGATLRLLAIAAALMALGYGLTAVDGRPDAPPFVPPDGPVGPWTMSQRSGSVTYLSFSAGFALASYVAFVLAIDVGGLRVGLFGTLGRNALAAYILHPMVASAVKPYLPRDAPGAVVAIGFGLYFGLTYLFVRYLERNAIHLKL